MIVCNLPPLKVFVRKEFLMNHCGGTEEGDVEEAFLVSVRSVRGKAFYFEVYLPLFGAVFDKLPVNALLSKVDNVPLKAFTLSDLQLWDCFSNDVQLIEKTFLKGLRCRVRFEKDHLTELFGSGTYLFTLESIQLDPNSTNTTLSQYDEHHKSFNFIALDSGHFALQPNNRVIFYEKSLTPTELHKPYFKACTQDYVCESSGYKRYGEDLSWSYDSN